MAKKPAKPPRTARENPPRNFVFLGCLILALLPFLLYANSLSGEFHYDDIHSITQNPHLQSLSNLPRFFTDPSAFSWNPKRAHYRPVLVASYALNYALFQYRPLGWHLTNILLHSLNGILFYLIFRRLLAREPAALFAALLFVCHPLATEPVNYISSRSELLMAFFFLLGFWLYLLGQSASGRQARLLGAGAALAYLLSILSKENGILLLAFLLLVEFLPAPRELSLRNRAPQLLRRLAPFAAVAVLYLFLRRLLFSSTFFTAAYARPLAVNLFTQTKALFAYLRLLLWPVGLSVEHDLALSTRFTDPGFLAALFGLFALLALLLLLSRRGPAARLAAFSLAWFLLSLLTTSVIPLNLLISEHRLYLGIGAFALTLALLIESATKLDSPRPKSGRGYISRLSLALGIIVAAGFGLLVVARNPTWQSNRSLWRDAFAKAPLNFRAARGMGDYYNAKSDFPRSLNFYLRGVALEAGDPQGWHNVGNTLTRLGRLSEAQAALQNCLKLDPGVARAYMDLGSIADALSDPAGARAYTEKAIALEPDNAMAHNNLGRLLMLDGQDAAAEAEYQKALALDPEHELAHYNLGLLLMRQGRDREALPHFSAAYRINPAYPDNLRQLEACQQRLPAR